MAGSRGPVPTPTSQRRRRNKPETPVDSAPAAVFGEVVVEDAPKGDPDWHPTALGWFESLARSGQARYYEASDWAMARLGATMMDKLLTADKPSAQLLASVLGITSVLLSTEGDRRRLRLELARGVQVDEDEVAADATVTDLRSRLGG